MDLNDFVHSALQDELEKIGEVRMGRISIKPHNLVRKGTRVGQAAKKFVKKNFKIKVGIAFGPKAMVGSAVSGGLLTIYGQKKLKKMKEDYQVRRAMQG